MKWLGSRARAQISPWFVRLGFGSCLPVYKLGDPRAQVLGWRADVGSQLHWPGRYCLPSLRFHQTRGQSTSDLEAAGDSAEAVPPSHWGPPHGSSDVWSVGRLLGRQKELRPQLSCTRLFLTRIPGQWQALGVPGAGARTPPCRRGRPRPA